MATSPRRSLPLKLIKFAFCLVKYKVSAHVAVKTPLLEPMVTLSSMMVIPKFVGSIGTVLGGSLAINSARTRNQRATLWTLESGTNQVVL